MPNWEEHYRVCSEAFETGKWAYLETLRVKAQKDIGKNQRADWQWFIDALTDPQKKHFVSWILKRASIPRLLLPHMIQAAIKETNPSLNKDFLVPCIKTYGENKMKMLLLKIYKEGKEEEIEGIKRLSYWIGCPEIKNGIFGDEGSRLNNYISL